MKSRGDKCEKFWGMMARVFETIVALELCHLSHTLFSYLFQ